MSNQPRARMGVVLAAATCLMAASGAAQERPTFRSGVDVVVIDVNVVDRSHKPVGGLQPGDFVVSVDGKRRKVVSAQFISHGAPATTCRRRECPERPPRASRPEPPRRPRATSSSSSTATAWSRVTASWREQAAEKFLGQLGPDDRVGVATIPWLRSAITMTKNRDELQRALAGVNTGSERFRPVPYNIGLAEAFAVERGEADALTRIINRECRLSPGDPACREDVKMLVREVQVQAHLRGARSLEGLRDLGEGLRQIEGPKTMVLMSGGAPPPDVRTGYAYSQIAAAFAAAQVTLYTVYIEQAQLGQVKDRLSPTYSDDQKLEMEAVANATSAAGGTFIEAVGSFDTVPSSAWPRSCPGRICSALKSRRRTVTASRTGCRWRCGAGRVEVRARRQYVINPGRMIAVAPNPPAPVSAPAPSLAASRPDAPGAMMPGAPGAAVPRRRLRGGLSATVFRGSWRMRTTPSERPRRRCRLRSDLLLVKTEADEGWVSFRDVYDVDGAPVRDRDDRLKKLFLEPSGRLRVATPEDQGGERPIQPRQRRDQERERPALPAALPRSWECAPLPVQAGRTA